MVKTKETKRIIPIFFATDDNYVPFLSVALRSIIEKASKNYRYNIHVLNPGLSAENIEKLSKHQNANFRIIYNNVLPYMNKVKDEFPLRDYYTKTIYFRLFIPNMFPQYNKALYLDCDIIVNDDISKLYNSKLNGNLLGGVVEETVSTIPEFINYSEKYLGVKASRYINSGILVMHLRALRAFRLESKFFDMLGKVQFYVAPDQDYINVICKDKIQYLSPGWNKTPYANSALPENEVSLIHYNLSFKPWHYDGIVYGDLFWKYAKQDPFYKDILAVKNNFTMDKEQKDVQSYQNLLALAVKFSKDENNVMTILRPKNNLVEITFNYEDENFFGFGHEQVELPGKKLVF